MALTIKLEATVNDKLAAEVLLKDTTGAYNVSTNPGGYGSANQLVTPTRGILTWRYWTDTTGYNFFLNSSNMTSLLGSGLLVSPSNVNFTESVFKDGIHQIQYFPLNDSAVNGTFTNGSKIVTLSATSWDPNAFINTALYVVGLSGGTSLVTKVLQVDWTVAQTTSQLTLKDAYDGTTQTVQLWFGPLKDIKLLVNKAGEACIAKTLKEGTVVDCGCSTNAYTVTQMIQWRFTADVLFSCEDYVGAHNTLVQINRVCNPSSCIV